MTNRRNAFYALTIACFLGGLVTGRAFLFNLGYLFIALLLFSLFWSWASLSRVQITRQTRSRRAQVGKTIDEIFLVRNGGILPKLWLEVRDHSTLPGHNPSSIVPTLLPGRAFRWSARTTCVVRGEFTLGPITLLSGDPFGLFQSMRHIAATSTVLIYPAIVPIQDFVAPTGLLSGGDAQRQRTHFVTTNAAGVREYAPGDSFNRIHWRSSARKDRLLVKEFELDPLADTWILLDLSAAAHYERPYTVDGLGRDFFIPPSSAEYGIVAATSLASFFLVKERTLGFATYSPHRTVLQPDRGPRQMTRILETLALARIEADMPFEQLVALEGHHLSRGTTAVLISADLREGWIREAHLLARRGIRTACVLLDARSFAPVQAGPSFDDMRAALESGGVITYPLRQDDNLSVVLSSRVARPLPV